MGRGADSQGQAAEQPRYSIAPLCMTGSAAEFKAWIKAAAPRAEFTYAQGSVLDSQRDVVVMARAAQQAGTIQLYQRRRPEGGFFYIARRVATDGQSPAPAPRRLREPDPDSEPGRVLAMLRRAANFVMPCPTNREIALALGLNDAERARYLIGQLIDDDHIDVKNRGPRVTRIVTIKASGKQTSAERTAVGRGFQDEVRG